MGYGTYRTGAIDGTLPTPKKIPGQVNGGPRRTFVEIFDLSKTNVDKVAGTNNVVAKIPAGHALLSITVRSTVSLTTTTLAFGIAGTAGKYGTAAAYGTTAEVTKEYLLTSRKGVPSEADETIIMTAATADLPASGTVVVEIETVTRG